MVAEEDSTKPQCNELKTESAEGDTEIISASIPGETPPNPLSKNQIKKQRKLANYERIKKERRLKDREKQKQKRQEALQKGLRSRTGPSRKELKKRQTEANTKTGALQVVIDLDFDELMSERDVAKCVKQCLRMYTINRRAEQPTQLHFTGIKNNGRVHAAFRKNDGWENWNIKYHFDETHTQAFANERIIYLTCESDTVLDTLQSEHVYVIGGLVDHNHQKGLCHERAGKAGLHTARLPLSEHVDMKTRAVLSTYHVFEILLRVAEGKTWTEAILQTLPMRKGAKAKNEREQTIINSQSQEAKSDNEDDDKTKS